MNSTFFPNLASKTDGLREKIGWHFRAHTAKKSLHFEADLFTDLK